VAAIAQRTLRGAPGFGEKVETRLLENVQRWRADQRGPLRLILADALPRVDALVSEFAAHLVGATSVAYAGALRRREEIVERVDLLVVAEDSDHVRAQLAGLPSVVSSDPELGTGRLRDGLPMRVHVAGEATAGSALLFATGSAAHLTELSERARQRHLELSAAGLFRGGARLAESRDEALIYAALDLPLVPPELRRTRAEGGVDLVELRDVDQLVREEQVRGVVHCHTTFSDGKHGVEEMARAAQALGFEYITITDHSPTAHYARGVALDRLQQQWDEIAAAQERVTIRILRGTESDILSDGTLDYPEHVLEQFDVIIASIHERLRMDRAEMTARLSAAMQLPVFKIWGHALGRRLLDRDPIDCDVERVLDVLAGARGAVELNGDPHRLDLPPRWIPAARERGLSFVVSADAHSTQGLASWRYAVMMARRGGIGQREVLNTLPASEFMARVRPAH
jgi:DNA polymerase (family 10)